MIARGTPPTPPPPSVPERTGEAPARLDTYEPSTAAAATNADGLRTLGYRHYGTQHALVAAYPPILWQRRHPTATAPDGDPLYVNVYEFAEQRIGDRTARLSYEVEVYADGFTDGGAAKLLLYGITPATLLARLASLESAVVAAVASLYASLGGAA